MNICNKNTNLKEEWIKISPDMANLYNKYLMKMELESPSNKKCIDLFISNISQSYCNKINNKQYMGLLQEAFSDIHVCISKSDLKQCEKKDIRQLLNNIEYNLYSQRLQYSDDHNLVNRYTIDNRSVYSEKEDNSINKFYKIDNSIKSETFVNEEIINKEMESIKNNHLGKNIIGGESFIEDETQYNKINTTEENNIQPMDEMNEEDIIPMEENNGQSKKNEIVSEEDTKIVKKNCQKKRNDIIIIRTEELVLILFILLFLFLLLNLINDRKILLQI